MSSITDYLEAALLNHVCRNSAYTSPTTVYLALFTSATADDGTGTEVSGGAYARQAVTFGAPTDVSGAKQVANSSAVTFPIATANWGTISHGALYDAASGGNMLLQAALSVSRTINTNDQLKYEIGDVKFQLA